MHPAEHPTFPGLRLLTIPSSPTRPSAQPRTPQPALEQPTQSSSRDGPASLLPAPYILSANQPGPDSPGSPLPMMSPKLGWRAARSPRPSAGVPTSSPPQASDTATLASAADPPGPGAFLGQPPGIRCVAFSPDGRLLASCRDDGGVHLWDVPSGQPATTLEGHKDTVRCVAFSADGRRLASGGDDNRVRVWDVESGACMVVHTGFQGIVYGVAFTPNVVTYTGRRLPSKLATVSGDKALRLWDVDSSACDAMLRGHGHWAVSVAISCDASKIATGSWDKTVRVWTVLGKRHNTVLKGHTHWVLSVAFSPDGKRLASGSGDCTVRLWDVASSRCAAVIVAASNWVTSVAFSPDGKILAAGSWDRSIKLWDVTVGVPQCTVTMDGLYRVHCVAISLDGKYLASSGTQPSLELWDLAQRKRVAVLTAA